MGVLMALRWPGRLACDPAERFADWPDEPLRASAIETIGADAALQ